MHLRYLTGVGAAVLTAALLSAAPAQAALISPDSELDLTGNVLFADFSSTGRVNFEPETAFATRATGDFADPVITIRESQVLGMGPATAFTMVDILDFTNLGQIYFSVGNAISFVGDQVLAFDNDPSDGAAGFRASGTVTLTGHDPTPGFFSLSTQGNDLIEVSFSSQTTVIPLPASVFMLLAALGGLGVVSRRRERAMA